MPMSFKSLISSLSLYKSHLILKGFEDQVQICSSVFVFKPNATKTQMLNQSPGRYLKPFYNHYLVLGVDALSILNFSRSSMTLLSSTLALKKSRMLTTLYISDEKKTIS